MPPQISASLELLAQHGVLGIFCLLAMWVAKQRDDLYTAESGARLADAQKCDAEKEALRAEYETKAAADRASYETRLATERTARITDAQNYATAVLAMNDKLHTTTDQLQKVYDGFLQGKSFAQQPPPRSAP